MPEISEEELKKLQEDAKRAAELEASKRRIEEENAKIKARAKEAEEKLSKTEEEKLQAEGKTQELLDKERARAAKLEEDLKNTRKNTLREKLKAEVSKVAKDAHDVEMLLRITEHKDLLKLDEETASVGGVEDFVAKARETHSYLFGNKRLPDYDNKKTGDSGKGGEKDEDFSKTDEEKYREELRTASSRKEVAEIRKKYGKPLDSYDSTY